MLHPGDSFQGLTGERGSERGEGEADNTPLDWVVHADPLRVGIEDGPSGSYGSWVGGLELPLW